MPLSWKKLEALRLDIADVALVVERFSAEIGIMGSAGGYVDPLFSRDAPPNELHVNGQQVANLVALAPLLDQRGIDLVREAGGREEALADLFLAVEQVGHPFWRSRLPSMYEITDGPGGFERLFGLDPNGGRPWLDGQELVFWTHDSPFFRWHLRGVHEIRWHLRSLTWRGRQLHSLRNDED